MPNFFVDPDIARAKTIDTSVYTSPELFAEMKERIFSRSWEFIGDTDLVKEDGNCYPFTLLENYLNEPLLLTNNGGGKIFCLSNVCTHRGNLVVYEACKASNLRCKYHGRLFYLDGKFKSMPEFKEVKDFPSANDDLHQLPLFQWGKFLFTSLDERISPQQFFKDMIARVGWMPLTEFSFDPELSKTYLVDANWALYCENYLEGFHIPFVHAGLNALIDYGDYETELFFPFSSLQIGISKTGGDCFDLPSSSPDFGKNVAAYYFWIFPNTMFNFYPWGVSVNIVEPVSVDKTRVKFLSYVWKQELKNAGAGGDLDKVELEDEEIVQKVQRGVRSRYYRHGRYSVTRERGTHHFHRLLADFLSE